MITTEQAAELRRLIEERSVAQNDADAEMICGHDWAHYGELLKQADAALQRFIDALSAPGADWVAVGDAMPDPKDPRRIIAFTPSEHPNVRHRLISADLFKTVCKDATHWNYTSEPAQ